MHKKSILFICSYLKPGGQERQLVELMNELIEKDISVHLILIQNIMHYKISSKIMTHSLKSRNKLGQIFEIITTAKTINFDIVHSWGPVPSSFGLLISFFFRKPHISSYIRNCEKPNKYSLKWMRFLLLKFNCCFIVSNTKEGLNIYGLKNYEKAKCIYNGFNMQRLHIKSQKHALYRQYENHFKGKKLILMVASFYKTKDWDTFIRLAEMNLSNDFIFLGIGEGPDFKYYKRIASKYDNIIFPGAQNNIETIIYKADVCLLLSEKEGFSNVITEYMAFAKPVITTSGGGTKELIVDNVNGYFCGFGDVNCISGKIIHLLEHPDVADKIGEEAKKRITGEFSINKMTNRYLELYRKCLLEK